ncbi:MAG: hypothetical protein J2P25_12490 [Nocardiopsaceae bacterium]|nr:hypothetical protein [Nocardiopsaceae bacterium]
MPPAGGPFTGLPGEQGIVSQLTSGASTAPTPTVSSGPPRYVPPPARSVGTVGMVLGYSVQTNVLTMVADAIKSQVPALDKAIGDLQSACNNWSSGALGSIVGGGLAVDWPTGQDFGVMLDMIAKGFIPVATQIADLHIDAVRKLADTASHYAETENRNYQAMQEGLNDGVPVIPPGTYRYTAGTADVPPGVDEVPRVVQQVAIKPGGGLTPTHVTYMNWQEIMSVLHNLEPGPCRECGGLLLALGRELSRVAEQVADGGERLAQNWQGQAAAEAINAFQAMYDQTATLAAEATQAGNVLNWVGNDVLPAFQEIPSPALASGLIEFFRTHVEGNGTLSAAGGDLAGNAKAQVAAEQYLTALDNYLDQAYNAIPSPIAGTPGS